VQVAHFLKAPTLPWVAAFWAVVQPRRLQQANTAGLGLVAAARPIIADLLCDRHPAVLDAEQPFTSKLCNAPAVAHAAVARSCVQQTPTGAQVVLDLSEQQLQPSGDIAAGALSQWIAAAMQALPLQQPELMLRLCASNELAFDHVLTAAEQHGALAGSLNVSHL
jgi:hypothetical protein